MKFQVTVEYRGTVTVDVEAEDEKQADTKALIEADQSIGVNLHVYDVTVKPIETAPVCPNCGWEIDPETCHCGEAMGAHTAEHDPVPAGCTCGYADAENRKNPNRK